MARHSPDLDLTYTVRVDPRHGSGEYPEHGCGSTILVFEDGVEYGLDEALHIARDEMAGDDLRSLHMVKKAIDGVLLPGSEAVPWFAGRLPGTVLTPPRRQRAPRG